MKPKINLRKGLDKCRGSIIQEVNIDNQNLMYSEDKKMAMPQWKVVFTVNGRRSETIVSAYTSYDARELVEAQYAGQRVIFIIVDRA